jgi:deazaflavin-dependent oxidoreductase (nitroreductase family)
MAAIGGQETRSEETPMTPATDRASGIVARRIMARLYAVKRWMYRGGRPSALARVMNRFSAIQFSTGVLSSRHDVTLEVPGRRTGRLISCPLVVTDYNGERYLVSMLGDDANWVHNVRANQGRATLRRGGREQIRLQDVPAHDRAPILRRYLALAPGARPHVAVSRTAPLDEFARVADQYPVFRILPVR